MSYPAAKSDARVRTSSRRAGRSRAAAVLWLFLAIPAEPQLVMQRVYTAAPSYLGVAPCSSLVQAPDGNFYGTIPASGSSVNPNGSVFRLTPRGVFTTVVSFIGINGKDPEGPLVLGTDGNLYGTTMTGEAYGVGMLFKVTTSGSVQLLHAFTGADTAYPEFGLLQARDGFLYGVTAGTSTNKATIYRASTAGAITVLTNLSRLSSAIPNDGLAEGADGCFYGTTANYSISSSVVGSIYKVAPNGALRTLATFYDYSPTHSYSNWPISGLTAGPDGLLYGVLGHSPRSFSTDNGSVFSMTTNGVRSTVFAFSGADGSNPNARLTLGNDGAFYGVTGNGGPHNAGTIFRITAAGQMTILADGVGNQTQSINSGGPPVVQANDGNFYDTSIASSSVYAYRLVPPLATTLANAANGTLTLAWNSFPNGAYQVYYKDALTDANWTALGSVVLANGAITTTTYTLSSARQRVYQVVLLP